MDMCEVEAVRVVIWVAFGWILMSLRVGSAFFSLFACPCAFSSCFVFCCVLSFCV